MHLTSTHMVAKEASANGSTADGLVKIDSSIPKEDKAARGHLKHSPATIELQLHVESQEDASPSHSASEKPHEDRRARETSADSKKRSLPESSEEPTSKKSKQDEPESSERFPSPPHAAATDRDKETWQGYCVIESDPAYFSVILRDIGIQGTDVQELHMMDPEQLITLPPIYGLILIFRHREFDQDKQEDTCPDNVWFANQMPGQLSCATLAMIHTLLNVHDPNIDIGEHMRQFKDFTQDMNPVQRGHTFQSWNYVRKIHNSFAKKMDMLEGDKSIASQVGRTERPKITNLNKAANSEKIADEKKIASLPSNSRSRATRRNSEDSTESKDAVENSEDSSKKNTVEELEDNIHHYIAFVPIDGEVWKLDGMDEQPTLMGKHDEDQGQMWFNVVSDRINALVGAGDNDYGIFAIMQSPLVQLRNQLCETDNIIKHVDSRLRTLNTDWKSFLDEEDREPPTPSWTRASSEEQRAANPVPNSMKIAIDNEDDVSALLDRHRALVAEMRRLIIECTDEELKVTEQNERAAARRWDYGPAIQAWVGMLATNGYLEAHIGDYEEDVR